MGSVYQPSSYAADSPQYVHTEDTTPKATGNKRLFSNRQSRQLDLEDDNYTHYNTLPRNFSYEPSGTRRHSDKRHRNEDWPLPSSQPPSPSTSTRPPLRSRHAPNSPNSHRRAVSAQRPSRFVEGSMNDRVSNMPPAPYFGDDEDEDLLYEYDSIELSRGRKIARTSKFTSKRNPSTAGASVISQNNENGGGRNSIYKFGKSIAATFNPSNWKIWSKPQPYVEETAQMKLLRERQSQAERIYRELKESGQFRDSAMFPNPYLRQEQAAKPKHDSGVEMEKESIKNGSVRKTPMSVEEKRKGRIFLEPPQLPASVGGSPVSHISSSQAHSNNSSPNKGFHFKKPSLSNLKRTLTGNSSTNLSEIGQQARRIPSRKDLQKQQKLVKRVSDLEGKLQAARQQLNAALVEPLPDGASQVSLSSQSSHVSHGVDEFGDAPVPPMHQTPAERVTRKRFVPGALASLPSERLLSGYTDNGEEQEISIGIAVSVDTQQGDQKWKKGGMRNHASPAWLGEPLHRRRCLSRDRPLSSVERDEDTTPMVKKSFFSTQSEVATTTISEPTTRDEDPNDGDYVEGAGLEANDEEELEKTPQPAPKQSPPGKKRKNRFMGLADDGGAYVPEETNEVSDPESEVKKLSTPRKQKGTASSPPGSNKQANPSRKLQKVSANRAKDPSINGPPTRAPPPPPTTSKQSPPNKHPARVSSLKATMKSPPPARRLSKPPPMLTNSQQSSSPPPSSSFAGLPDLQYKKPSSQRQSPRDAMNDTKIRTFADEGSDLEYSAHPQDEGVPAMPALPASIQGLRLSSGEIITTTAKKFENLPPLDKKRAKSRGGSVLSNSTTAKVSKISGKISKERKGSKRLEKKKESLSAALEERDAEASDTGKGEGNLNSEGQFEWPEDLEVF